MAEWLVYECLDPNERFECRERIVAVGLGCAETVGGVIGGSIGSMIIAGGTTQGVGTKTLLRKDLIGSSQERNSSALRACENRICIS